jgi:aerobic carbon-monoxide dehydrogenase small subunit
MKKTQRTWTVNGESHTVEFPPGRRLLDVLREDIGLKGTKEGCGEGECGACTVLLNGEIVVSCLLAAGQVRDGSTILTVEGLEKSEGGRLVQKSYLEKGAAQCGFCIPGMLISTYAFLRKQPEISEQSIKDAHAGNICRCTGYVKIIEAVQSASERWPANEVDKS